MIFGIGTDIVCVVRIERNLERFGEKFAERLLAECELAEFRQSPTKAHYLARRFAAKEAAVKAMGTGFSNGVGLRDIAVVHDTNGRPSLEFRGRALEFLHRHAICAVNVSLADEEDYAVAFVTLERNEPGSKEEGGSGA